MTSTIIAALSVLISLVAIVVVIGIFKYVKQFTSQLQQFGSTLQNIQSHMNGGNTPPAPSTPATAPVQTSATKNPTVTGSPRIFIQKQGHSKTRANEVHLPPAAFPQPAPVVAAAPKQEEEQFINFDCPICHQNIDAPLTMAGSQIKCPTCYNNIVVPASQAAAKPEAPPQQPAGDNVFHENVVESARKDVTIRIDLGANLNIQEPDQASIQVKRQNVKVRRA
ncbi:MAG: hypothetical protein V2A34_02850 [Lentisphaerota bacterium]